MKREKETYANEHVGMHWTMFTSAMRALAMTRKTDHNKQLQSQISRVLEELAC